MGSFGPNKSSMSIKMNPVAEVGAAVKLVDYSSDM